MSMIVLFIFILSPFISIPFIFTGIIYDKKHNWIYGLLLAVLFALIAYNFVPTESDDLYRYYVEMKYFSKMTLSSFLSANLYTTKALFKFIQYIFSSFNNYRWLPFIITLIGYYISFYMILDFSKIKNYKPSVTISAILIYIFTFYHFNFISGLAQYLAISIGVLAFYLEFIKKKEKKEYKLLYIIPVFIHASMIIIPIFRMMVKNIKKMKSFYIIFLILYVSCPNIIYLFTKIIPKLYPIADKIDFYMIQSDTNMFSLHYLSTVGLVIFYVILFNLYRKKIGKELPYEFLNFIQLTLMFNIFSIFYTVIFTRILNITILCMSIFLQAYFVKNKKSSYITSIFIIIICIFLGGVTVNILKVINFNNAFDNLFQGIWYYIK